MPVPGYHAPLDPDAKLLLKALIAVAVVIVLAMLWGVA